MNYKGKTIFKMIVFPLIFMMLLEGFMLYGAFEKTGILDTAQKNSIQLLDEKLANRTKNLDYNFSEWSNLDTISEQINIMTASYLEQNHCTYEDISNKREITDQYLEYISGDIMNLIRSNSVTGAFMVLCSGTKDSYLSKLHRYSGIYFRSTGMLYNQDNSGVILERGPDCVAKYHGISLDSNWQADFLYNPLEKVNSTDFFMNPLNAAYTYPNLAMDDLGYWASPFCLNSKENDTTQIITFSRPVCDSERNIYAIVGVEVSLDMLCEQFGSMVNDDDNQSYYFISYSQAQDLDDEIKCNLEYPLVQNSKEHDINERLLLSKDKEKSGIYKIENVTWDHSELWGKISELSLYHSHSPYVENQWAVLSVSKSGDVFYSYRTVMLYCSIVIIFSILLGFLLVYLLGSYIDRRIRQLAIRVKSIDMDESMDMEEQPVLELTRLEDAIIMMREEYRQALYISRKERERYLISLESSADAVFEYDCSEDRFCIYQFEKGEGKSADLKEKKIEHFIADMISEEYCRREDVSSMTNFLNGRYVQRIEVQMRTSKEEEYSWMAIRGRALCDKEGKVSWIIGNIRKIDEAKERELREQEINSIDKATKLLINEVGEGMIRKYLSSKKKEEGFSLCMIDLDEFRRVNEYYGLLYGDIILQEVGEILRRYIHDEDVGVRIGGDEFLICLKNTSKEETYRICNSICKNIEMMYIGEGKVKQITCSIGFVYRTGFVDYTNLIRYAGSAMCEIKNRKNQKVGEYFELREEPGNNLGISEFEVSRSITAIMSNGYHDNDISVAYNILEKGINFRGSLRIILKKIGHSFRLSRILIVNTDIDKGADWIDEQWYMFGMEPVNVETFHYDIETYHDFISLFNKENYFITYRDSSVQYSPVVQSMMHYSRHHTVMYCALYDLDHYLGYIQFKKATEEKAWTTDEVNTLKKLVDIISAHYIRNRSESKKEMQQEEL